MKVCIIGQGAAGWMAATAIARSGLNVDKITIIGSKEIKSIGVGESNTWSLRSFFMDYGISEDDFVRESDAAVKLGVYYQGWGTYDFLHNFKKQNTTQESLLVDFLCQSLTNKSDDVSVTDIIAPELWKKVQHNLMPLTEDYHDRSWHFDAAKFISFLENLNKSSKNLESIKGTIVDCIFSSSGELESLVLKSGKIISADYFVFASGSSPILESKLGEKYIDLSDKLLTDKAWVYPLEYTDKRNQFYPYTVAKAMNCGWRWITPTYSRIGTGYVFSSKYISEDEALDEFLTDIGDKTITPNLVDFKPRYNQKSFKKNYCTIGMANGFLEPLDAPGLTLTINSISRLIDILEIKNKLSDDQLNFHLSFHNHSMEHLYKKWCAFILTQYKTSNSNFNKFWCDHRSIEWDYYDEIWDSIKMTLSANEDSLQMFCHTAASRNFHWKTQITDVPIPQDIPEQNWIHHLDFIDNIVNNGVNKIEENIIEDTIDSKEYFLTKQEDNIWELNDNLNIIEEIFEGSKIYYIDNFYKNPDKVLEEINSKNPPLWKITEPNTLNSLFFEDRRLEMKYKSLIPIYEFISSLINQPAHFDQYDQLITNNLLLYNHPYNDFENNYWWPHRDGGYTGILYLNKDCGGKSGTNLYKKVGEDLSNGSEHSDPWRPKKLYDRVKYLESNFNRLVLFDGLKYLHGANIESDRHMKECRMNQVFFFESVDS